MMPVFIIIGLAVAVVIPLFVFIKLTRTSNSLQGCLAMAGIVAWVIVLIIIGIQLVLAG